PNDLRANRLLDVGEVEHAGLGGQLGVEDDLEEEVAELAGEGRARPGLERVVDLVCLLEEMATERGVRLLAVPRAAVRLAKAVRKPGQRPGARRGTLGGDGREVQRTPEDRRVERAD